MAETAYGAAACAVALAFALWTYERWLQRRRRHDLAWSVALSMFAVAAGALAAGATGGWHHGVFRLFYLFGAIVNVPFLALGTVYLLGGQRVGDRCAAAVALFAAFAAGVTVTAPFTAVVPVETLPRGSEVFGPLPRILAASASGIGALVVFAGAAWSAFRFRRGRMLVANVLIALGTAITSASGLLNSVVGEMTAFAVTLLVGIVVIFAGFVVAVGAPRLAAVRTEPPATAAPDAGASRRDRQEASRRTSPS